MPTPANLLWRLLEAREDAVDPEALAWLQAGVARYLRGGGDLDAALGLPERSESRRRRDLLIRRAGGHLHGGPYERARALAALTSSPARLPGMPGPVAHALRQAMAAGALPRSVDQLARILKRAA